MKKIIKYKMKVIPNVNGSCIIYEPYTKLILENGA
mgnify:CR=1 FL=1